MPSAAYQWTLVRLALAGLLLLALRHSWTQENAWIGAGFITTIGGTWAAIEWLTSRLARRGLPALPGSAGWLVVVAVALDSGGHFYEWYATVSWYDAVVHGISGAAMASLAWYGWPLVMPARSPILLRAYLSLTTTVFLAVLFEFTEYVLDRTRGFDYWLGTGSDTVLDLMASLLGALLILALASRRSAAYPSHHRTFG